MLSMKYLPNLPVIFKEIRLSVAFIVKKSYPLNFLSQIIISNFYMKVEVMLYKQEFVHGCKPRQAGCFKRFCIRLKQTAKQICFSIKAFYFTLPFRKLSSYLLQMLELLEALL